ncbi:MAG: hypothetical protein C4520_06840 [Candidatus Abyssobacteria bacterium SURF_5]|uniref:Uncharacterized protein n=1 Tax=Abyssobacteria bacterium (strain SURF_5) TaxID=2093360 RepID=A0A3A4P582_ABYX5|nr:MAG: hypothetical protein C4520_06840 [Candidatus Abyssubacteria bacterium SURF_5]
MLMEAGVTVTTPDGVFSNCLKIIESDIEGDEGEAEIMIWAPDIGEVKTWAAGVEDADGEISLGTGIDQIVNHGSF